MTSTAVSHVTSIAASHVTSTAVSHVTSIAVSHVTSIAASHVTSADESLVWLSVTAPLKNIVTQNEDVFEQTYTYLLT